MANAATRRFDRFSKDYAKLNGLQTAIARELIDATRIRPKRVADLGCGDGAIYRQMPRSTECFVAIDASLSMLALHPSGLEVHKTLIDFNDAKALSSSLAALSPFDLIVSSCALQWAADLDATLKAVAPFGSRIAFAIFTDGALSLLRNLSGAKTPALSIDKAREIVARYFKARFWTKRYRVEFASKREMFAYIRKSGVGGGLARLGVADAKRMIAEYPSASLDYETLFAIGDY
ncbi:MAG: methyltransferase domain-containing protein [Helicobacteraceae bacterium]|jgi:malonyl-CoA O-methyltransferase|nr:methyltransferase domain-containing protein [Helicobacteraceae bacterium]